VFLAGAWLIYSTVHNMDTEEFFRRLSGRKKQRSVRGADGVYDVEVLDAPTSPGGKYTRGPEPVSDEEAARLQQSVNRAVLIGRFVAGVLLTGIGAFGIIYFVFFAPSRQDEPIAAAMIGRAYFRFIMLCVLAVLFGVPLLLRPAGRQDTG